MIRRLILPALVAASLLGSPAHASATERQIVAELREQGFVDIEVGRTLLGRTRIVAKSPDYRREIVFNPNTGVILRDFWVVLGGETDGSGIVSPWRDDEDDDDGDDNSGSGSDGSGRDSDDDDDDDDDDGDDDSY